MKSKPLLFFAGILFLALSLCYGFCYAENNALSIPAQFPDLIFDNLFSKKEQAYLGIENKRTFSFNNIESPFLLVDLTNTYCVSCKKNIKIFNEVYKKTQADKEFKEKIKVIGIAIGNNEREVDYFRNEHKILYPIIIDPEFTVHKALGEPRVPYTMFIRRDAQGKYIVVNTHRGKYDSADELMNDIRNCLFCDTNTSSCVIKGTD